MTAAALPPLAVALPLLGAALCVLFLRRPLVRTVVAFAATGGLVVVAVALLAAADGNGPVVASLGGWPAPVGITLVGDRFGAIILTVSALMLFAVLAYSTSQLGADPPDRSFHAVYLALAGGVVLSILTGDLFNLYVGFEIMLIASYVLLTARAGARDVRATITYVVVNLLASALFLTAIAFAYAATGTVNMADLSVRLADIHPAVRDGLGYLTLVVFGIKAGIFPLFMWLPDSYPTAPTPVTAIFAGLLTKIGVTALIRTRTLLFAESSADTLLLFIAGATMLVGVLGAIAQNDVKRILSFHIVSQIGYMVMGLGLFSAAGIAATILYMTHHIVVKTGLFLVAGLIEAETGRGSLDETGGLLHSRPIFALLFLPLAFSLAGIPPLSGFVAKLGLVIAGLAEGRGLVVAVSLAVSLLTLYSMTKVWAGAFWGDPRPRTGAGARPGMVVATAGVVSLSLLVAVFAGPLADLTSRAATELLTPDVYVAAVLGG